MNLSFFIRLIGFLCLLGLVASTGSTNHSRTKREFGPLVFPEGSNVQLVYCVTTSSYAKPSGLLNYGITAGQAWPLPSRSTLSKDLGDYHRRSRRELYRKVELLLGSRGKDGKACVLKAICDAAVRISGQIGKGSFLEEIFHAVFTIPERFSDSEPLTDYEKAYFWQESCQEVQDKCPNMF